MVYKVDCPCSLMDKTGASGALADGSNPSRGTKGAEEAGLEPARPLRVQVFQTCAIAARRLLQNTIDYTRFTFSSGWCDIFHLEVVNYD